MIVVAVLGVAIGWWLLRRRGGARQVPRDGWTVVGLVTWRPLRRCAPLAAATVGVALVAGVVGPVGLLAVAAVAGVWSADVVAVARRAGAWSTARRHADRWVWAVVEGQVQGGGRWWSRSPYPMPRRVRVDGSGNVELTVTIPPRMSVDAVAGHAPAIGAYLNARGLRVVQGATMGEARVEVLHRALRPGRTVDVAAPTGGRYLTVGHGFAGEVLFDVDDEVGLAVWGSTGSGKGVLLRWIVGQALDPAVPRRVILVDGQGSPEWEVFARVPNIAVLRYDPSAPVESLRAIDEALAELAADVAARNELCVAHRVDGWRSLPPDVQAEWPRVLLVVDETTALVGKVEKGDPTRELRESIGQRLGVGYRTWRKGGVGFVQADQLTYSSDTYLGAGSVAQLGRWIALGSFRPEGREMVSGFRDWPYVAAQPGLGLTGRRGDPEPQPVEIPYVSRGQLAAQLDVWHSHVIEGARIGAWPEPDRCP